MVVFRCECEEILGVEENNADKLGECPSCGVIVKVPSTAANFKGRLKKRAASSTRPSIPASLAPVAAAIPAEPEPAEPEPVDAIEADVPAEVKEAAFDAEIADLRANTVPSSDHAVEEQIAKHSDDEVSSAQEVDVIETPQEVPDVEPAPEPVPEPVAEVEPEPVPELAAEAPVAEAPVEEAPVPAPVAEDSVETGEDAAPEEAQGKRKLSKRERLKLKKKKRELEEAAPAVEASASDEAPVAEDNEAPIEPPVEMPPFEEPAAATTEMPAAPAEEVPAKGKSGIKSGIRKPMVMKGKAAIGTGAAAGASGPRKGASTTSRSKKDAPADGEVPAKKGSSALFIVGGLILLAAIGGAVMYFKNQGDGEQPGKSAPATKETKGTEAKKEGKAPTPEAPKTDAPKDEAAKTDAPAEPAKDAPPADAPKSEAPKDEAPKTDAPKADAPKEAPKTTGELPKEAPTAPAE